MYVLNPFRKQLKRLSRMFHSLPSNSRTRIAYLNMLIERNQQEICLRLRNFIYPFGEEICPSSPALSTIDFMCKPSDSRELCEEDKILIFTQLPTTK